MKLFVKPMLRIESQSIESNELSSEPLNFRQTEIYQVPGGDEMEFPRMTYGLMESSAPGLTSWNFLFSLYRKTSWGARLRRAA